VFDFYIK